MCGAVGDSDDCRGPKLGDADASGLAVAELRANVDIRRPAADLNWAEPSCPLACSWGEPLGTGVWVGEEVRSEGRTGSSLGRKHRDMKSIEYLRTAVNEAALDGQRALSKRILECAKTKKGANERHYLEAASEIYHGKH